MSCRFVARDQPRAIKGRHDEDACPGESSCPGCLPCTEPHCRVCSMAHAEQTCPGCMAEARDDLRTIGSLCAKLPTEVVHTGVDSEAMALLAPAADAEAWGHITTSLHVGRLPRGYLLCDRCRDPWPCARHSDHELHPVSVLGTWEFVWRDALDHESDAIMTIPAAVAYLDQQLTHMAGFEDAPFEDFARDLRRCRAHLEAVLHDGEQVEEGAPCMKCGTSLRKIYAGRELPWHSVEKPEYASEDGWACPRCKQWHNGEQYKLAVRAVHCDEADWLSDEDMEVRTRVKANTVRSWARANSKTPVRKRRNGDRMMYSVEDVLRVRDEKGLMCA